MRRLRWLGHVARKDDSCIPKCILFGELEKTRPRHGLRKRWRDNVVSDMKDCQIVEWYDLAQDRREWRTACSTNPPTEPVTFTGFRHRFQLWKELSPPPGLDSPHPILLVT